MNRDLVWFPALLAVFLNGFTVGLVVGMNIARAHDAPPPMSSVYDGTKLAALEATAAGPHDGWSDTADHHSQRQLHRVMGVHRAAEETRQTAEWKAQVAAATRLPPRPSRSDRRDASPPAGDVWGRLAACESGMRNIRSANGLYYGYFQFLPSTWHSVGGTGLPTDHGYSEQLHRAQILQARAGWGQWPACSRTLGLR